MLPALGTALPGMLLLLLLLVLLLRSAWPYFFQDLPFALAMALVAMRARRAGARTVLDIFAGRAPHKPLMLFGAESTIELTTTFKYCKVQLMEKGFNPAVIKDCLYFLDDKENVYVQITQDIYNSVKNHDFKPSM